MTQKQPVSFFKNQTSEEIIEVFFRQHYGTLCKSVNRLLLDPAMAEDLVQEVFIRVWEKRDHLDLNERFIFYLKKSCYHAALSFLSSGKQHKGLGESPPGAGHNPSEEHLFHLELQEAVRRSLGKLPEKTQLIFSLSRYEEMTYREIAAELKISVKAVEKHMSAALRQLKESLKDYLLYWIILFLF